jgi:hypothetical protein
MSGCQKRCSYTKVKTEPSRKSMENYQAKSFGIGW